MKSSRIKHLTITTILLVLCNVLFAQPDKELFSNMEARSIGPAGMSGRIADIEVVGNNTDIIYVGSATGGLWKSKNGGVTWDPIFDNQPVSSIGAVSVYQKNPNIIYVGTGEGNPRNSVGVGYGMYKSLDGGKTWKYIGLKTTQKIHRVIINPHNPDVVYAAALGPTWKPHEDRGVYKTTDGGKTWEKILYKNDLTGCADLVMDPSNPNKLFAAMWEHRRWPWFFNSGGEGSGLYRTYDGGESWTEITHKDGLPKGNLGRIGLAISRNNTDFVYALVEAKDNSLCRSEDGGHSWKIVNSEEGVNSRPFYYADIYVDPDNENRIYSLQSGLKKSEDGGKTFERMPRKTHSDKHAMWINPNDGSHMIQGTDGGIGISFDRGSTWRFVENIPVGQFYHISVDNQIPYNVYGGMQDNGSWTGPANIWEANGIANYHWKEVGFGDGFGTLSDPEDPNKGYSMWQEGNLMRFDLQTGERKKIRPAPPTDSIELRFNWNAPIAISPFNPDVLYFGSQFVHKSKDKGDSWEIISPDLTTNNEKWQQQKESGGLTYDVTGAENFTTIFTIEPSPIEKNVIWAGTDDGNVQITRDGGDNWENVVNNIPDLPDNAWCSNIEASNFNAGTAYITFDDHRRGNWTTYIYKTEDFGQNWKSLTKNNPAANKPNEKWGFAHTIVQDYKNKNLLFLGTEFGLYISFDDGKHWMKWTNGVPTVPVRDMVIQKREDDLVLGTHGRAAFILDDINPLRSIQKIKNKKIKAFDVNDAFQHQNRQATGYHFPADAIYRGENQPYGSMISYYINPDLAEKIQKEKDSEKAPRKNSSGKGKKNGEVSIKIYDKDSTLVRTMKGKAHKGINRIYWNLETDGYEYPTWKEQVNEWYRPSGPEVVPGQYTIKIALKDFTDSTKATILSDPRNEIPYEHRKSKFNVLKEVGHEMEKAKKAVDKMKELHHSLEKIIKQMRAREDTAYKPLIKEGEKLQKKIKDTARLFVSIPDDKQGITRENNLMRSYWRVGRALSSTYDKPTETHQLLHKYARKQLREALNAYNKLFRNEIKPYKEKVRNAEIPLFPEYERIKP